MRLTVESYPRSKVGTAFVHSEMTGVPLFKEPWWWNAVSRAAGIEYDIVKIVGDDQDMTLMPLFRQSLPMVKRVGAPLRGTFTPYVGMRMLDAGVSGKECLEAMVRHARTNLGANWLEFGYAAGDEVVASQVHGGKGWEKEEKSTFVVDLAESEDAAWAALEGRARNMVRKAEKNGVQVVRLQGTDDELARFYSMLEATFAKSGRLPPHSLRFYRTLVGELGGRMLFLGAVHEETLVAFGLFPFNGYEIHYLSGTSSPAGNALAANNLIQWEVIRIAVRHGLKRYDLGGGGIPSIDKFKMSFGGRPEAYFRYTWMAPWLRVALGAYLKARPVVERVRARLARRGDQVAC